MKILTILIFSGERLSIKWLLNDLVKLNKFNIDICIVEWSTNKKNLVKKNQIYKTYKKKIESLKINYQKGSWEYKYKKYINTFKSKYILLIGDDDRINVTKFKKIFKYLKFNYSGITTSFKNFQNNEEIKKDDVFDLNEKKIRSFDLNCDLNKIGFTSCQIIKTNLIKKIFQKEKKNLTLTKFPQNFIILGIIRKFNNWKVLDIKCIYNHAGSIDIFKKNKKNLLKYIKISDRLKSEYLGYFLPLKNNFSDLNLKQILKIYKNIFFKNIISWVFLSIKLIGKKNTYNNIKNVRQIFKEPFSVKVFLILIYLCPVIFLDFIRILRNLFKKVFNIL